MADYPQTSELALGVDLGGTKIFVILADAAGRVVSESQLLTPPTYGELEVFDTILEGVARVLSAGEPGGHAPQTVTERIHRGRIRLISEGRPVVGLGIGVAGVVSGCGNIICQAPNLGWKDVGFRRRLEIAVGLPVLMDNDTNVAAWGEYCYGGHGRPESLVYLGVGTGIGGGIVLKGKLYKGSSGGAGEIGHVVVEPGGPVCSLGHPGCLEAMASGLAIARIAKEEVRRGRADSLLPYADGDPELLTAQVVGTAVADGNPLAQEILTRAGTYLGIGIASVINILNPEVVVIGGGVARMGEAFLAPIQRELEVRAFPELRRAVRVCLSGLGRPVGALGASAMFFQRKLYSEDG
ncbi:MAG: ROK family protein [Firmicutes bacterium]|nr:ROK family protein [Bacillota bacterium]